MKKTILLLIPLILASLSKAESLVEIYDTMYIYDSTAKTVATVKMTSFPYIAEVQYFSLSHFFNLIVY
jgi:hypothetical protein